MATFITMLIAVAFAAAVTAQSDMYIVAGAGDDFAPPPGYLLATLAQVKSTSFTSLYNYYGLRDAGERMSPNWCSVLSVADGYLVMGQLSKPSYVGPYGTSRQPQTENVLTSPVWFGLIAGGSLQPRFIGPLTTDDLNALYTIPFSSSRLACNQRSRFGIYIRAEYLVAGYGRDYPNPPESSRIARLADVASIAFTSQYNGLGLNYMPHSLNGGCCVLNVLEGALRIEDSFLTPYTPNRYTQCSMLNQRVWLGTGPWGRYPNQFIGQLNASIMWSLNATQDDVPDSCATSAPNTYAIYMRPTRLTPVTTLPPVTTPAPTPTPVYYVVDFEVNYMNGTYCWATLKQFWLQIGVLYPWLNMTTTTMCKYDVRVYNFMMKEFTATQFNASTTGSTNCDCNAWNPVHKYGYMLETVCNHDFPGQKYCNIKVTVRPPPSKNLLH